MPRTPTSRYSATAALFSLCGIIVPTLRGDVNAVKGSVTIAKDFETHTMTLGMSDVYQKNNNLQFRVYGDGPEEKPG